MEAEAAEAEGRRGEDLKTRTPHNDVGKYMADSTFNVQHCKFVNAYRNTSNPKHAKIPPASFGSTPCLLQTLIGSTPVRFVAFIPMLLATALIRDALQ